MKVVITGANGFLGSHLCREALMAGFQVYAWVRPGADLSLIRELSALHIVPVQYESDVLKVALEHLGPIDIFVHNAGIVSSPDPLALFQTNIHLTEVVLRALQESKTMKKGRFVHLSSMAAQGPVGANGPVSTYGRSKLATEELLKASGLKYVIMRPTAIYGPGDKAFLPLFKTARWGLYPLLTRRNQKMTLVHVSDVASTILKLPTDLDQVTLKIDDGHTYSHGQLASALGLAFGKKIRTLRLPSALIQLNFIFEKILFRLTGKVPFITPEKYAEIAADWEHEPEPENRKYLNIRYSLPEGFLETLEYYRKKELI